MHRVPLSKQAMAIIENIRGLHTELVFPSPRKKIVLSDMVLTAFLHRVKAKPGCNSTWICSSFRDWCSEHGYRFLFYVGRCHSWPVVHLTYKELLKVIVYAASLSAYLRLCRYCSATGSAIYSTSPWWRSTSSIILLSSTRKNSLRRLMRLIR